jgi:hypothetical protein
MSSSRQRGGEACGTKLIEGCEQLVALTAQGGDLGAADASTSRRRTRSRTMDAPYQGIRKLDDIGGFRIRNGFGFAEQRERT